MLQLKVSPPCKEIPRLTCQSKTPEADAHAQRGRLCRSNSEYGSDDERSFLLIESLAACTVAVWWNFNSFS